MISVFRPFIKEPVSYQGFGDTPLIPFNHTIESLTRDVAIKPLHSHNDYWRKEPLFDALKVGCQSIESDVWFFSDSYEVERTVTETTRSSNKESKVVVSKFKNNEVYVGHNQIFLEPLNTLYNLYLNPLYTFLTYSNPQFTVIKDGSNALIQDVGYKHGVYYNSPETPLYFWMDIKTEPISTYNAIKPLLKSFIEEAYLAHYDNTTNNHVPGPVILTITGNLPTDSILKETKRYAYIDAPLAEFTSQTPVETLKSHSRLSRVASASLEQLIGKEQYKSALVKGFTDEQKDLLSSYFQLAHKYDLKTRIWGGINWPNAVRILHMRTLYELGCDFLNADEINDASKHF